MSRSRAMFLDGDRSMATEVANSFPTVGNVLTSATRSCHADPTNARHFFASAVSTLLQLRRQMPKKTSYSAARHAAMAAPRKTEPFPDGAPWPAMAA
eukprot:2191062-Rhodomonas_salina.1